MGFIPDEVTAWAADYGYTKEMGGALPYRQLPARWAVARGYYLTRLAKYKQISAGGGQARQQAEQATAAGLKAMFDAKRQEQDGNV